MVWLMLATLTVVFVVGFRVLTSGSRRAIKRLSERLGVTPEPVESMIDQMGKRAGEEYLRYLERPNEAHLLNAAQVLLIWQVAVVDGSESNLLWWHRHLEPDVAEFNAFQHRYNALFMQQEGVSWLH